jgi:LytS/YehU family sensor histidine kinase
LAEEAEIVADYLALESARFEGRLRVRVSVDPEARAMQVPPMILQALVENALKHGVARRPEGGNVEIHASADNGRLMLQVTNTGQLVPARPGDTQLGLKNIRERLHLLYGDRASLSLQNGNGIVVAKVEIPSNA